MVPFSTLDICHREHQIVTSCVLLHLFFLALIGEKGSEFPILFPLPNQRDNSQKNLIIHWKSSWCSFGSELLLTTFIPCQGNLESVCLSSHIQQLSPGPHLYMLKLTSSRAWEQFLASFTPFPRFLLDLLLRTVMSWLNWLNICFFWIINPYINVVSLTRSR